MSLVTLPYALSFTDFLIFYLTRVSCLIVFSVVDSRSSSSVIPLLSPTSTFPNSQLSTWSWKRLYIRAAFRLVSPSDSFLLFSGLHEFCELFGSDLGLKARVLFKVES